PSSAHHTELHSFPTRRSSDLFDINVRDVLRILRLHLPYITEYMEGDCVYCGRRGRRRPASIGKPLNLHFLAFEEAGHVVNRCPQDRKSTRLNSSHVKISYAVF